MVSLGRASDLRLYRIMFSAATIPLLGVDGGLNRGVSVYLLRALCIGSVRWRELWRYRYNNKNHEKWLSEPDTEPKSGLDPGSTEPVSRYSTTLASCEMQYEAVSISLNLNLGRRF